MRLKYYILWFEDSQEFVDSAREDFEEFLKDKGFELEVSSFGDADELKDEFLRDSRWNLVLMDYQLSASVIGTQIINRIRSLDVNTEIVFYSSDNAKLHEHIRTEPLEGVYWAGRSSNFQEKVKNIIELTIRKVMDLTNMRGLVMAEVADIDTTLEDIVRSHHSSVDEGEQSKIVEKFLNRAKDQASKSVKKLEEMATNAASLDDCLSCAVIDSSKRLVMVQGVAKSVECSQGIRDLCREYNNILKRRNDLAHGRSEVENGSEVIRGRNEKFSAENALELRREIIKHRDNFFELLLKVSHRSNPV
ncbi:MAG: hypothetical protein ACP59X_16580 [Solidesulfovibrio sp. DCME]|uniref:hypothetical protein n=1 Tax=Solidesulfovibrio sp. DCME TaxID=3447380 RepID=UPI003D0AACFC